MENNKVTMDMLEEFLLETFELDIKVWDIYSTRNALDVLNGYYQQIGAEWAKVVDEEDELGLVQFLAQISEFLHFLFDQYSLLIDEAPEVLVGVIPGPETETQKPDVEDDGTPLELEQIGDDLVVRPIIKISAQEFIMDYARWAATQMSVFISDPVRSDLMQHPIETLGAIRPEEYMYRFFTKSRGDIAKRVMEQFFEHFYKGDRVGRAMAHVFKKE
ncbi:hypothetical protein D3C74_196080 [compost metagenome]